MFSIILLLAAIIALSPTSIASVSSIQPLQYEGDTFCTTFSINETEGFFATSGHCAYAALGKANDKKVTILNQPAIIETISIEYDLAVFYADVRAPALHLAKNSVEPCIPTEVAKCEMISIQGFPYGLPAVITATGHVAARNVPIRHSTYVRTINSDVLDIAAVGGSSGSPIMNSDGDVIGILWGGYPGSSYKLSIPLESVREAIQSYFEG